MDKYEIRIAIALGIGTFLGGYLIVLFCSWLGQQMGMWYPFTAGIAEPVYMGLYPIAIVLSVLFLASVVVVCTYVLIKMLGKKNQIADTEE